MKRIVLIALRDPEGKVLLQHKDAAAPNNPNTWCLFGGQIEPDESMEEAAGRELSEELEIQADNLKFLGHKIDIDKDIERFYLSAWIDLSAEILKKQQHEGDDLGFFSMDEIKSMQKMNPAHQEAVIEYLGKAD